MLKKMRNASHTRAQVDSSPSEENTAASISSLHKCNPKAPIFLCDSVLSATASKSSARVDQPLRSYLDGKRVLAIEGMEGPLVASVPPPAFVFLTVSLGFFPLNYLNRFFLRI